MATLSLRYLTFSDLVRYSQDVGPLLLTMHLVPTITAADGRELPPLWPTLPISPTMLRSHFLAYGRSHLMSTGRWWTALTSMLLHQDGEHLASNAVSLIFAGLGPHVAFGSVGWWLTLLGGHLAAVLTAREGQERQTRAVVERYSGGMLRQDGNVAGWLSKATPPAGICGCSAGTFALMGADLCLTLERVLALVAELRRAPNEVLPLDVLQALGFSLPALQRMLAIVDAERHALAAGASLSVGHAAHLTGFGWGVLCYLVCREARRRRWAAPWRQLVRRFSGRRAPAGRRLGRA